MSKKANETASITTFPDRLRSERTRLGLRQEQAAAAIDATRVSWSYYETDVRTPGVDVLMRLAQAQLGFDINYLVTGEHTLDPDAALLERWVMVNRYDVAASAGNGSHVEDEQVISRLPIDRKLVQELGADPEHLALIGVQGRSMEPLLKDKDLALLDTRKVGVTKDVWAFESEDGLMVKQIEPTKLGIRVISLNPDFKTKIYSHNDSNALRFIGRVVWRCGRV